jgi:MerR family mercuric resistance operon transcriptional regulator
MQALTIGKVAKAAGVGVETIRFYEREGLLPEPPRRPSGYRAYDGEAVRRIRFIAGAKRLGFALREIAELLDLRVAGGRSCAVVRARALAKLQEMEQRIAALLRMKRALARLAAACEGEGPTAACPILEALEEEPGAPP